MNKQIQNAVALAIAASAMSVAPGLTHARQISHANSIVGPLMSAAVSSGNVLYAGGSTAVTAALTEYFLQASDSVANPCNATAGIEYYSDSNPSFIAFACIANTSNLTGVSANTAIAFVKEGNGGSANSLLPVGQDTALSFPVLTNLTSTNCGAGTLQNATAVNLAFTKFACSGEGSVGLAPNFGFSDVDPALFGHSAAYYGVSIGETIQLVFAPAVSLGLYHALQQAEGITTRDDALANMPNLTKAELTSIFEGQMTDWDYVSGADGTPLDALTVAFGTNATGGTYDGKTTTPSTGTVFICRRDDYSGTEKTDETYFGATNTGSCLSGINAWVADAGPLSGTYTETFGTSWTYAYSADTVVANNGTGSLLKCLEGNDSLGHFAIGYASVDNPWGANGIPAQSATERDFRYIKMDGIVPSIENAAAGRWPMVAQSVFTVPAVSQGNTATNTAAVALLTYMTGVNGVSKASVVAAVNALDTWSNPSFDGGAVAIPFAGTSPGVGPNVPPSAATTLASWKSKPVNMYYHGVSASDAASSLTNCQPLVLSPDNNYSTTPVGGMAAFAGP